MHVSISSPSWSCCLQKRSRDCSICSHIKYRWNELFTLSLLGTEGTEHVSNIALHGWDTMQWSIYKLVWLYYNSLFSFICVFFDYASFIRTKKRTRLTKSRCSYLWSDLAPLSRTLEKKSGLGLRCRQKMIPVILDYLGNVFIR